MSVAALVMEKEERFPYFFSNACAHAGTSDDLMELPQGDPVVVT
ncbi:hypothetical protein PR002_g30404 [Phytophthora rubi]|uniref:Uncharacterized protein n=1 Tax=Phytophthora rubi TaxID=129364 RepID=A0A6A3GSB7_9STRA|nr:hypothetical protein PR002_g30404 [Phytophthora rubi]